MSELHFSNLRLTIWTLAGDGAVADRKLGNELGEAVGAQIVYAVNMIPSLVLRVPAGIKITDPSQPLSYADETHSALRAAYAQRTPVAVCLESSHSLEGLPSTDSGEVLCLFKGYIVGWTSALGVSKGQHTLHLTHWLADLHIFPVLHRLSSPENPGDLSCNTLFRINNTEPNISAGLPDAVTWSAAEQAAAKLRSAELSHPGQALKNLLLSTLDDVGTLKETDPGYVSKELLNCTRTALEKIDCEQYGTLTNSLIPDTPAQEALRRGMANWISAIDYSACIGVTIWQKLISLLLPALGLGLVPTVNKGYIVPGFGLGVHPKQSRVIPLSMITQFQYRRLTNTVLGGMILAVRDVEGVSKPIPGVSADAELTTFRCPQELKPGVLKGCFMPGWLADILQSQYNTFKGQRPATLSFASREAVKKAEEAASSAVQVSSLDQLCQAFVNTCYLQEMTKDFSISVKTPLKLDLVPGDIVEIPLPTAGLQTRNTDVVYGTIQFVTCEITNSSVNTCYVINNLRPDELLQETNGITTLLYEDAWRADDTEASLYCKEKTA